MGSRDGVTHATARESPASFPQSVSTNRSEEVVLYRLSAHAARPGTTREHRATQGLPEQPDRFRPPNGAREDQARAHHWRSSRIVGAKHNQVISPQFRQQARKDETRHSFECTLKF